MDASPHLLVFGATGAIGSAVCTDAMTRGWRVTGVARSGAAGKREGVRLLSADPCAPGFDPAGIVAAGPFDAVCWAQGANTNDSVRDVDAEAHLDLYRANCLYIVVTLKALLAHAALASSSVGANGRGARLCIVSSIWQNLARQSKLSYCMTKAALSGLVLSAAADLATDGHLVNAVLPGALETPMTRKNLGAEQIERLTSATGFGRLATLDDVARAVCWLCSTDNTGITGQFIAADLGFSRVRLV